MIAWLRIETDPPLLLTDARARFCVDPGEASAEILAGIDNLRADVFDEIPYMDVALLNDSGQAARALARPPLGAAVALLARQGSANVELFRGVVSRVSLDASARLTIESDIKARAPLRDTTTWPGYREARWIPRRYGHCGGEALQYDDTRTRWCWAEGASLAVDAVFVGGQRASGWTWENTLDAAGRVVTMIVFGQAVAEGAAVVARGRGALHPTRGGLMESPAEVLWDILANLGRLPLPEARFAAFGQQCAEAGLIVGGSVDTDAPLYEIVRALCSSIGAVCSPDMLGFARIWPGADGPAVARIERRGEIQLQAQAQLTDVVRDLTLRYAHEAGEPRGAVQYRVAGAPASAPAEIFDAPWLSSRRVASLVCARLLAFRCRPQWELTASNVPGELRIGDSVEFDHPLSPVAGEHMVLARELFDAGRGVQSTITVRAPVGAVPPLELVRDTNASEPLPAVNATAAAATGEFSVTVLDDTTGQPMAGAQCTLDGLITRTADSSGRVTFPSRYATPGEHTIVAVAAGRPPVTMTFTVT